MDLITTKEIHQAINQRDLSGERKPFSISFYTCNLEKKTGGDLIHIDRAEKCSLRISRERQKELHVIGVRPIDEPNKHDYTVHVPLIYMFNGKKATF